MSPQWLALLLLLFCTVMLFWVRRTFRKFEAALEAERTLRHREANLSVVDEREDAIAYLRAQILFGGWHRSHAPEVVLERMAEALERGIHVGWSQREKRNDERTSAATR